MRPGFCAKPRLWLRPAELLACTQSFGRRIQKRTKPFRYGELTLPLIIYAVARSFSLLSSYRFHGVNFARKSTQSAVFPTSMQ